MLVHMYWYYYFLIFLFEGVLNPLDSPHHLRIDEELVYREGVVVDRPVGKGGGSFVNAGLRKEVKVDKHLKPGTRVTVKLDQSNSGITFCNEEIWWISDTNFVQPTSSFFLIFAGALLISNEVRCFFSLLSVFIKFCYSSWAPFPCVMCC